MLIDYIQAKKNLTIIRPVPLGKMSATKALNEIIRFVEKTDVKKIALDLSKMDFFTAIQLGVLVLTKHFIKHVDKKMFIIVRDELVLKSIDSLNLDNAKLILNDGNLALDDIA